MTLDEAKNGTGRAVIYKSECCEDEYGVITGVNNKFVFVRYSTDYNSKATSPGDLIFQFDKIK